MNKEHPLHIPVLVDKMINFLDPQDNKIYVDCTFGAGGYTTKILKHANCKVIAIDQDPNALNIANNVAAEFGNRFQFILGNFINTQEMLYQLGIEKVDGIVMDLGVSSMQLDQDDRGFSFRYNLELDMRMSNHGIKAKDWINTVSEKELADVIYYYGEEPGARKIAKQIIKFRKQQPINTTFQLAELIRSVVGYKYHKIDPATKTFQAIRIFINDELSILSTFLPKTLELLKLQGKLIIVSFHSLEDSIIKDFFKSNVTKKVARSKYSKVKVENESNKYELLTRKPVVPTRDEVKLNRRSRSAKLRAAVRMS